jgi:hypothetical protein
MKRCVWVVRRFFLSAAELRSGLRLYGAIDRSQRDLNPPIRTESDSSSSPSTREPTRSVSRPTSRASMPSPNRTSTGPTGVTGGHHPVQPGLRWRRLRTIASVPSSLWRRSSRILPGTYFNVHTGDFPGGALRGQLRRGPASGGAQRAVHSGHGRSDRAHGENFVEDVRSSAARRAGQCHDRLLREQLVALSRVRPRRRRSASPSAKLTVLNDILGTTFNTHAASARSVSRLIGTSSWTPASWMTGARRTKASWGSSSMASRSNRPADSGRSSSPAPSCRTPSRDQA